MGQAQLPGLLTRPMGWPGATAREPPRPLGSAPARAAQGLLAAHPTCPRARHVIPPTCGLGSSGGPKHLWGPEKIRGNERLKRVKSLSPNKDKDTILGRGRNACLPLYQSKKANTQLVLKASNSHSIAAMSRSPEPPLEPLIQ